MIESKDLENAEFYKKNKGDVVWWVETGEDILDKFYFSFDKVTIYDLFQDHDKLTDKQKKVFFKENPFWANFFGYKEQ